MSRHLSTHNILSKSMHAFLSNLAHRQTNEHGQKHILPRLLQVTNNNNNNNNKKNTWLRSRNQGFGNDVWGQAPHCQCYDCGSLTCYWPIVVIITNTA